MNIKFQNKSLYSFRESVFCQIILVKQNAVHVIHIFANCNIIIQDYCTNMCLVSSVNESKAQDILSPDYSQIKTELTTNTKRIWTVWLYCIQLEGSPSWLYSFCIYGELVFFPPAVQAQYILGLKLQITLAKDKI